MEDFINKLAIVTGGAQGIGRAIVKALLKVNAHVIILDIDKDLIDKAISDLMPISDKITGLVCDITDNEAVGRTISKVKKDFNSIDILVNNAGITNDKLIMRMKPNDWNKVIDVNLNGTYNCTQKVSRIMMKQKSGKIVNIASIIGIIGNPGQSNYAASKGGIIAFTKSIAKELAPRGINVNAIAPGFIKTKMTNKLSEEMKKVYLKNIPMQKFGKPHQVAELVIFLCSEKSEYITGQTIAIDGGMV